MYYYYYYYSAHSSWSRSNNQDMRSDFYMYLHDKAINKIKILKLIDSSVVFIYTCMCITDCM